MSTLTLVVNLHEIDYLDQTLAALAQQQVRDCTVQEVEAVPSYHAGHHPAGRLEPNTLASMVGLFKRQHNVNYLVMAITDEAHMDAISAALKALYKDDRYACSFWFMPTLGYWYHNSAE